MKQWSGCCWKACSKLSVVKREINVTLKKGRSYKLAPVKYQTFVQQQLQYGTAGSCFATQLQSCSLGTAKNQAQHPWGSALPALWLLENNTQNAAQRSNFPQRADHEPKSQNSGECRRSPRQSSPHCCPAQSPASQCLLQLHCGQGEGFSPFHVQLGPLRICMLRAKIGGAVPAQERKFWVIKAMSSWTIPCTLWNHFMVYCHSWPEPLTTHSQKNLLKSS